ncbi:hypothetical protein SAMN06264364_1094 [Quadrisphaera granulorum]|uniref:Uncharacterized protein n=1 Tax=Quadrisphaera granulorum TaxID=317664 RepID=A0A316A869_9ACTN|nr:hypothetical protein [Quadrisphaera granulorum]PWJ53925.1 hypothetical protein BXY45_1094 [Quadrisphaera granulorum]SZE96382.1 hypothetical protein SAMN06264364_1094 [Quadrisphaera granulorum]
MFARTIADIPAGELAGMLATWTIASLAAARAVALGLNGTSVGAPTSTNTSTSTSSGTGTGAGTRPFVPVNARRMVISMDGQTARGSGTQNTGPDGRVHIVSAYEHASGLTLGQVATGAHNTHAHTATSTTSTESSSQREDPQVDADVSTDEHSQVDPAACTAACRDGSDRSGKGGEVAAARVLIDDLADRA